jgi:uncharacterized sodium:solute symporter family permease YidK
LKNFNPKWKAAHMLIIQILLVPIFALILVGGIFIIGAASVTPSHDDNPDDLPVNHTD